MRILLFVLLFLSACTNPETRISSNQYYDVAGLVNEQIKALSAKKPLVEKNVMLANKQERIETKDIDWEKELELFLQADLNKQSYQLSYVTENTANTTTYRLKPAEKLPVKYVAIEWDENKKPRRIEAVMQTSNYLYESDKTLVAIFEKGHLSEYQIKGYQELFVGSRKNFAIHGKIKGNF
ncbi:hypothetical protein [Emticicia sp. 17c]|uniref:hypothetical protein n=1 Tax=Emticicia sp. 17c TaxID=3127704 RepID=UPI00301BC2BF